VAFQGHLMLWGAWLSSTRLIQQLVLGTPGRGGVPLGGEAPTMDPEAAPILPLGASDTAQLPNLRQLGVIRA